MTAAVAVVLLLDAVEFQQLRGRVAEMIGIAGQFGGNPPAEIIALRFDAFQRAEFR